MGQHSPVVECEVDTCVHWLSGNICSAGNIDILHEEEGVMARKVEQTECKTFSERRGSNLLGGMDNVNWTGTMSEVLPGKQATPTVTCVVDSCTFWSEGNLCDADNIKVSGPNANECQDTNCETFENSG